MFLKAILLTFTCVALFSINGYSQNIPFIENLQFNERTIHHIKLPSDTKIEDIHSYDIPSLLNVEESNTHQQYLDDDGNPQEEIVQTNAINCYEEWEDLASRWIINQDGIKSYQYVMGRRGSYWNEITQRQHTGITKAFYTLNKQNVALYGFLRSKVYPNSIRKKLVDDGVPFSEPSPGVIILDPAVNPQVPSTTITVFNENYPPTITTLTFNDTTTTSVNPSDPSFPYTSDPDVVRVKVFDTLSCGVNLLTTVIDQTKDSLVNGLCCMRVVETYYNNYSFRCDNSSISHKESIGQANINQSNDFSLYPNPLNGDQLYISIPKDIIGQDVEFEIRTIEGKSIKKIFLKEIGARATIAIGKSINQNGLYLLNLKTEQQSISKKFYYSNN